jgi:transposase
MAKSAQKLEARQLRREGFSINEITRRIGFSKRTVSRWCNDIVLNNNQKGLLWARAKSKYRQNFQKYCEAKHEQTLEKIQNLTKEGVKSIGKLSQRELFIAGVALYWAEGFKKDMRFGFANTDPGMVKFCLKWLKESLGISDRDISLCVTVNESYRNKIERTESYWENITGIPKSQFTKSFFQKTKWLKEYETPEDYHGVLRIRVNKSTDLLRKIKGYIEGLKKQV